MMKYWANADGDLSGYVGRLCSRDDVNHAEALRCFQNAVSSGHEFLVHSYIILECSALFARKLGKEAACRFLNGAESFRVRWVDAVLHRTATRNFLRRRGRFSLVDEVSFLVMEEAGIRHALAFDNDFAREGFLPYRV